MLTRDVYFYEPNPFAAQYVRPGAIPFLFPTGVSPQSLWTKFSQLGFRAQIVGPHGSGKSTLVRTLLSQPPWVDSPKRVYYPRRVGEDFWGGLDRGKRGRGRLGPREIFRLAPSTLVVVDGVEQLGIIGRALLRWVTRVRSINLLVTSHRELRPLATLLRLEPRFEVTWQLVRLRLAESERWRAARGLPPIQISEETVRDIYETRKGNIREVFFDLYDVYEELRRSNAAVKHLAREG